MYYKWLLHIAILHKAIQIYNEISRNTKLSFFAVSIDTRNHVSPGGLIQTSSLLNIEH